MNTKKQNKKKKGFTLIELIIVIAIIAILAAIAIPNFLSIQRKSKVKADIASAKNIYDVTSALVADNQITNNCAYVLDPSVAEGNRDIVEKAMQTIPTSKSIQLVYSVMSSHITFFLFSNLMLPLTMATLSKM